MVFFAWGGVAYFILPYASGFLYGFQTKDIELMLTADAYFGFITCSSWLRVVMDSRSCCPALQGGIVTPSA